MRATGLRRALRSRDSCCRFPGCSHRFFLDGHHIRHWADGGETKLSNLVLLCRFHHRQVHEGRVQVRMLDDGALRFTGARGQALEDAPPAAGDPDAPRRDHAQAGLAIDRNLAVARESIRAAAYVPRRNCVDLKSDDDRVTSVTVTDSADAAASMMVSARGSIRPIGSSRACARATTGWMS